MNTKVKKTLPALPEQKLDIIFLDDEEAANTLKTFSEDLDSFSATLVESKLLSVGDDVKEIYGIKLKIPEEIQYDPGDTVRIYPNNLNSELCLLFNQLEVANQIHKPCIVKAKDKVKIPSLLDILGKVTTLHHLFTHELDIRCLPKKLMIRVLAEFTGNQQEKNELEELCSREGASKYVRNVLETKKTFLDLFLRYPSCCPPVVKLLEMLPKLQPRPYSIASAQCTSKNIIQIVFSVIKFEHEFVKTGLCSAMLAQLAQYSTTNQMQCRVSFRKNANFHLPQDSSIPLILVAPGTGLAPFLGFLEQRQTLEEKGKVILFYGCRYKDRDFLFRERLQGYIEEGVLTNLYMAFSRDPSVQGGSKYVQDSIRENAVTVGNAIFLEKASVYVCGDARNMRQDILESFVDVSQQYNGVTRGEAVAIVNDLKTNSRYLEDVWH